MPVDLDPRVLLRHGEVAAAQPRLDVRDGHAPAETAARAPASVEFVSPKDDDAVGPLALDRVDDRRRIAFDLRGVQVQPVARLADAGSSKKTSESSRS